MTLILFTSLLCLVLILIYIYFKRRYTLINNNLPGDKPQIFFGNLLNSGFLTRKKSFHEILHDYQRRYGDKFTFWFGLQPYIVFCLPEHIQTILSDRHTFEQSSSFIPNFDLVCPNGIVVLAGAKWKRHVRVMLPVFKRAKMIQHLDTITECADHFIDQCLLDNHIHTDLVHRCQTFTMNVIGLIAFDYNLESNINSPIKIAFQDFVSYVTIVILMSWLPQWISKIYLKFNWKYQKIHRLIRELTEKIVEQEQNNSQRSKNLIASLVSSLNEQANDEQISSGLTRIEMLDEILTSMLAGYETTSTALAWFIFYMSKYPHVQQRIKQELHEHNLLMTNHVQYLPRLTSEKLDSLIYCECVTKEVLRLAPTATATTRIALRDTIVDNVPIHRGQTVIIGLNNVNTDARYWHDGHPNKFIPERFLGKDKDHHPFAMLPFGGGHRACIGQDLAWLELKLVIVRLMQRGITFEDTIENGGGYQEQLTCFPKNIAVRVHIDKI
ncbi:unnamed protein product [Adineta steineri]|uniref:Cytochrome P450 n=1 Tax=Adineta steineri TaxID=433720 RepID=A0A815GI69_9BILA|nr:unnamed protein product [Adineta steineri]CAF1307502.1 unnamed protein product [Adineta steineri]CAF1338878.1 unnamed protein product [Adineta steineri]CAF1347744.1 unnamed protein product [Adineta steineri]CAF1544670.1 unnamed protein product [Adineta steineri]